MLMFRTLLITSTRTTVPWDSITGVDQVKPLGVNHTTSGGDLERCIMHIAQEERLCGGRRAWVRTLALTDLSGLAAKAVFKQTKFNWQMMGMRPPYGEKLVKFARLHQ